ncbi:hypothetical protein [Celeribacter sp. ULVN23_4]
MKQHLTIFLSLFCFLVGAPRAADARYHDTDIWRIGDRLIYVQELRTTAHEFQGTSLCVLAEYDAFVFVPMFLTPKAYVLSQNQCEGDTYTALSKESFESFQTSGWISPGLSETAKLPLKTALWGHMGLIWIVFAIAAALIAQQVNKPRRMTFKAASTQSEHLIVNMLAAMSAVAVSDGKIDDRESYNISAYINSITGRYVDIEHVRKLLQDTQQWGPDMDTIGVGLRGKENMLVLDAVLSTMVIDRDIDEQEHAIALQIAEKLGLSRGDFMLALERTKRDYALS